MKTYLQAFDLWEVVNANLGPPPLRANHTIAQIWQYSDDRTKRYKAMSCLQNNVSDLIFTKIIACDTPKQAWDKFKEEFQGTKKTRQQQLINLRRDFENLKMKETETIKQYSAKIMEQRRASKQEEHHEGAFQAMRKPTSNSSSYKGKKSWADNKEKSKRDGGRRKYPSCSHCKRTTHLEAYCWIDCNFNSKVKVGNGQYIKEEGKGDVMINTPSGTKLVSNVLLVPEIDRNLLSIVQLLENGYSTVFKNKEFPISDPSEFKLMLVVMIDRIFVVDWNKETSNAYTTALDESKLWHRRMGHVNYGSLL
ncbi:uncharacterized protein [Gossypium hirsutum]|uniref:Retrovirus-related Pol polyprotein from transposon TNT 1-94-like beta-barrel domain-containing protein n=1 Tax=Gossypium hirsutum TaxID=3635 RepID=A0A1U8JW08_GOSHI|nr:uncharacterized protein LOC107911079 [Gossypium hirsutum]